MPTGLSHRYYRKPAGQVHVRAVGWATLAMDNLNRTRLSPGSDALADRPDGQAERPHWLRHGQKAITARLPQLACRDKLAVPH
jgi:hypothetical protein